MEVGCHHAFVQPGGTARSTSLTSAVGLPRSGERAPARSLQRRKLDEMSNWIADVQQVYRDEQSTRACRRRASLGCPFLCECSPRNFRQPISVAEIKQA